MITAIKNTDINWWKVFFVIFVAIYASLMLVKPNLGPVDDYVLLRTLQIDKPLLYYFNPPPGYGDLTKTGRLAILGSMEYNLLTFFSKSPPPFWYFFIHAFQYVLFSFIFVKILSKFTSNKFLIYITPVLLSLFPGMTIAFFRTHIAERNLIFYYAIFLFFYLRYLEKPKLYYLIFGVISANMVIHFKENVFIALAAFAFCHLLLSWKKSQPKADEPQAQKPGVKIFDGLVLLGSLVYLLLYYFIVFRHLQPDAVLYGQVPYNPLLVFIKLFLNYGLFADPILILILLPFTARRIYKALRRQLELHPIYDSMLIAGSMIVMSYLVLNRFGPNYLFPAYIFALPPLIYFFSQREQRTLLWRSVAAVVGVALLFNTLPSGIHYLTYYKYLSINFNKTLDFLISDINSRYPNKRANIFLDAIDSRTGSAVYYIFAEFLQYKNLSSEQFDLKSNVKTEDTYLLKIDGQTPPFSIFKSTDSHKIESGDYLIVPNEATTKNITKTYIQSLANDYNLLFKTKSPLAFPNINLKTLIKYFLSKRLSQGQKEKGVMIDENLMQWPDYYVFIKR